uniref:Uncharacterized protein n=1 Tax=viral metagenome TaxID=1070528 RepID=A0A6C0LZ94_9ZZZZ
MEDLKKLYDTCTELDTVCKAHINRGIAILTSVDDDPTPIVSKIKANRPPPHANQKVYTDMIVNVVSSMVKDSQIVKKQLKPFTESFGVSIRNSFISHSDTTARSDTSQFPFLAEVWCGDAYDAKGIGGLRALIDDLKTQTKELTMDRVVKTCCTMP